MCHTKWCYGECDECIADAEREKEYGDSLKKCPHTDDCILITNNVKQDQCETCGKIFNY